MSFTWFTSNIGYPNFFKKPPDKTARVFLGLAEAARTGEAYKLAKRRFPEIDPAQVETKKAGFQEAGLLFVVPGLDRIALTPLGQQIHDWCSDPDKAAANRRPVLLALAQGLARHQFQNPRPVGSPEEFRKAAASSDVRPYLAGFYLLACLDGWLTGEEFLGTVCGLEQMAGLRQLEQNLRSWRQQGGTYPRLPAVAALEPKTQGNLKSYFFSHLSLGHALATIHTRPRSVIKLTAEGAAVINDVLDLEWPGWRQAADPVPAALPYQDLEDYMVTGVGAFTPVAELSPEEEERLLDPAELAALKELLPDKEFEEGKRRLVLHLRWEKTRSAALVKEAKERFKWEHGRLFCEACSFDFEEVYGGRGEDFIEGHHREPLSSQQGPARRKAAGLALVCANCHRMLHRPPWITVEELRQLLEERRQQKELTAGVGVGAARRS